MTIVDVHTHIFPPPVCSDRAQYFTGEPAFELLYRSNKSKMVGAQALIAAMDENGVDVSVVFGFPWRKAETYKRHNDYILEATQRFPGRLVGLGCFDPFCAQAPAEAERCLQAGMTGIGELAFYQSGIDDSCLERLAPIMALCRSEHHPVLIHTNEPVGHAYPGKSPNTLNQIYQLVKRFSENRIVLAHWGGGMFFYNLLKKEVPQALHNVYFDTAASPYLYEPSIYRHAMAIAGPEKILFGSDFPLLPPTRYFKELDAAGLTANEIHRICGTNALCLFGDAIAPSRS